MSKITEKINNILEGKKEVTAAMELTPGARQQVRKTIDTLLNEYENLSNVLSKIDKLVMFLYNKGVVGDKFVKNFDKSSERCTDTLEELQNDAEGALLDALDKLKMAKKKGKK